uniref:Plastocyanin-like domain-containing protein n=1 Tax=Mola mola TaxID=94237 RepID=A0A3Q4ACE4_MOLML
MSFLAGLLGPTLRAEEGETIVVTFRNMATGPYSIHPHGVAYGKQSEGAHYFDNTSQKEKEDDVVQPNSENIYYWGVTPDVSPQPNDPTCLTYTYISHKNVVEDYNTGLIGTLLVCKPGKYKNMCFHLCLMGAENISSAYFFYFCLFIFISDVTLCAHASVSLHLVGMSSNPEVFSVHINGQVLQQTGHKMSSVGLISGSAATASMVAFHTGRWLLSSHTIKHMEVGMHGFVNVKKCDGFEFPQRRMTIAQKQQMRKWTYYIAAEEIIWDYAPNMPKHIDEQSPTRIGGKYKKAVYVLYKNESFTEKLENKQRRNELGILGPVIRAQIRDVIKIVFKNKASKPYSIYPHGLTIEKSQEGYSYPHIIKRFKYIIITINLMRYITMFLPGNQSHSVKPGETHTYEWNVVEEDKPLDSDSRCLTRIYHSAVDTPRDIASGLIGPMLICKSQSLNVRNVQLKADKEQHSMFAVFDENKSWYLDDNIRQYSDGSKVKKAEPGFYKSNVMHTINGYAFENGTPLGFCNGEVVTWHVSSIGAQDCIQTATFYGHPFELNERTEDFLSLYPMTGETITMNMDNIGQSELIMPFLCSSNIPTVETPETFANKNDILLISFNAFHDNFCENSHQNSRETKFTKVVFRSYMDSTFSTPEIHGEIHEHLGILGPVIKAEVQQTIMVVFKNNAKRPYSLHPNGYWYKYDNEVQPNATFTYVWKVNSNVGPKADESKCRTWAYYSGVNPERDIHSGLIGPLLVCQVGTLDSELPDMREFILLFMTFDESQSWYYEKNHEIMQRKNRRKVMDPNFKENLKFHSINGIVYNLKGLRMYTNQLVCWHLINMGSPHDFQSVHFHGQTFLHKKTTSYRRAIYPLLPGGHNCLLIKCNNYYSQIVFFLKVTLYSIFDIVKQL